MKPPRASRLVRAASLATFAVSLLAGAPSAEAYCRMTTEVGDPAFPSACVTAGKPLAWDRRCIEYAIDHRGSATLELEQIQDVAAASFATWAAVRCGGDAIGFVFQEAEGFADCQAAQYKSPGGNVNAIAFVPDLEVDDPAVIALTSVWFSRSTGTIFDADIMINEKQGPFEVCPCAPGNSNHVLKNVLTHEIGHFLGLAHTPVTEATMFAQAAGGEETKEDLASDDIMGLCAAYPAGSLPSECNFIPNGGRDLSCHTSSGRGCSVEDVGSSPEARSWSVMLLGFFALVAAITRRLFRRR